MATRPLPPIHSSRAHDPDAEIEIDAFIYRLGEVVDGLQDTEASGDTARLGELAAQLACRSRQLGFAALASAAEALMATCQIGEPEAARKAVEELTEVAQRVRRGHRSAAS